MRFWKTYQAMEGEFIDPDELIFLPKDHALIPQQVGDILSHWCRTRTVSCN